MEQRKPLPLPGILIALAACVGLLLLEVQFWAVLAIFGIWLGSLWLVAGKPPPPIRESNGGPLSRASIADLIENSSTPILMTERDRITVANKSARKILGEHIVNQDARVGFRHPEAIKLFERGSSGAAIIRGLARRRDIWRMNRQQLDGDKAVIELINRTAEEDISRAHTDFVANASHELRTPLASIIGYVETMEEEDAIDPETSRKFLGTISREAKRLKSLVDDLMSLSRVEAEKHDQPSEQVALASLVESAARDTAGPGRLERLDFAIEADPHVHGDPQQLEQLVRNLADNALKYGDPEEKVTISLGMTENGQARIAVRDRGEGIAPEHLPHLTRRFYRTDPGRSRASGGTGLGLAIVKHIVERHRGRLDIDSKLGQGTEAVVRIPALDRPDRSDTGVMS